MTKDDSLKSYIATSRYVEISLGRELQRGEGSSRLY